MSTFISISTDKIGNYYGILLDTSYEHIFLGLDAFSEEMMSETDSITVSYFHSEMTDDGTFHINQDMEFGDAFSINEINRLFEEMEVTQVNFGDDTNERNIVVYFENECYISISAYHDYSDGDVSSDVKYYAQYNGTVEIGPI